MPVLRTFTNDDLLSYSRLCSICYGYLDTNVPEPKTDEQLHAMRGVFAEDGSLLSAMTQHPFESMFFGKAVRLCGIGGVVTDPTSRAGGNIRQIFETDLPRLYQEGYVFSALYPFSYYFYGKFGYTWAEFWRNAEVERGNLLPNLTKADEIIRVLPDDDDREMRYIYNRYIADKQFPILRNDQMWNEIRKGAPWETLKHAYILRIEGEPVAYWIGRVDKAGGQTVLRMIDMAWTCGKGMEAVFAMIRSMNEVETIDMRMYSGFDARLVVTEAYDVTEKTPGTAMMRVVNVEKALSMLPAPPVCGSITIAVTDKQIDENCGCFMVCGDGNNLSVTRTTNKPDIVCSIQGFTALAIGRQSFPDAIFAGVVDVDADFDDGFAELLFKQKRLHVNRNF